MMGIQKLKQSVRNNEIVCLLTDKSGRTSVDSQQNYVQRNYNTRIFQNRKKVFYAHTGMWYNIMQPMNHLVPNFITYNNDIPMFYGLIK